MAISDARCSVRTHGALRTAAKPTVSISTAAVNECRSSCRCLSSLASSSRPYTRWLAWPSSSAGRPLRSCGRTILRSGWLGYFLCRSVWHAFTGFGGRVYLSRRVGAKCLLCQLGDVAVGLATGLSLLQPLPCLEKSGSGVADHTVAAVHRVRSGDLASKYDYVRGAGPLGRCHAISGRPSLALLDCPPGHGSPAVCLLGCLPCALVGCGRAQLPAPARSRQPAANPLGNRGNDDRRDPVRGCAIRG